MPYLIDGNNLCGAARDRRLGMPTDPAEMVRRLAGFARSRRASLTVVFDGAGRPRPRSAHGAGQVRVIHSGRGRSADDRIVELVERDPRPRDVVLVSSDRALRSRVRALGARVMGCAEFADRLRAAQEGGAAGPDDGAPSAEEIAFWERYFSADE